MGWKDWLTSSTHNIYTGTPASMQLAIANCEHSKITDTIKQLIPEEYRQGYLRYLRNPDLVMIDYGSPSTFIFVQY